MASQALARPVRIVLAKVGLDGHDRGVKVVARALRDAGYEVIYTGLRQTPEMVVDAELRRRDATDILVFGGGIIPDEDIAELKRLGVAELFPPGTSLQAIVDWLRERFPESAPAAAHSDVEG